jgi:hypothetical protein
MHISKRQNIEPLNDSFRPQKKHVTIHAQLHQANYIMQYLWTNSVYRGMMVGVLGNTHHRIGANATMPYQHITKRIIEFLFSTLSVDSTFYGQSDCFVFERYACHPSFPIKQCCNIQEQLFHGYSVYASTQHGVIIFIRSNGQSNSMTVLLNKYVGGISIQSHVFVCGLSSITICDDTFCAVRGPDHILSLVNTTTMKKFDLPLDHPYTKIAPFGKGALIQDAMGGMCFVDIGNRSITKLTAPRIDINQSTVHATGEMIFPHPLVKCGRIVQKSTITSDGNLCLQVIHWNETDDKPTTTLIESEYSVRGMGQKARMHGAWLFERQTVSVQNDKTTLEKVCAFVATPTYGIGTIHTTTKIMLGRHIQDARSTSVISVYLDVIAVVCMVKDCPCKKTVYWCIRNKRGIVVFQKTIINMTANQYISDIVCIHKDALIGGVIIVGGVDEQNQLYVVDMATGKIISIGQINGFTLYKI